jgi:pyridoxal phosphate enzyme (YggS family)
MMPDEQKRKRIEDNLAAVSERIEQAAERAGRAVEQVRLVAVTKGYPSSYIRAAYALGHHRFGENRVEEAIAKLDELADLSDLEWHMVGQIQSRKARMVAPRFDMVHSVDRIKLARRLDHYAAEAGRVLPVLLECNVSGEQSKAGWMLPRREDWPVVLPEIQEILAMEYLDVRGLMTMAPFIADESVVRRTFRRLRELRDYLEERIAGHWQELSMGMSSDFEIAIEEGATLVRVGQAIFGPRDGYC